MRKLTFPLILLIILISCEKKMNDKLLSPNELSTSSVSSNSVSSEVVTPEAPPASIPNDITVPNPVGTTITVITTSEYNALDPIDQVYYSGLKNAIQYLFQDPGYTSTNLQFNDDGSYIITVNTSPDDDDDGTGNGGECTVCGARSAYACKNKVEKYMKDNNIKTINAKITVQADGCVKIVYFERGPGVPATNPDGTIVETYPPTITPSDPPVTITFPYSEFDNYIFFVKYWATHTRVSNDPITDPATWTRQDLIRYIREFNTDSSHPVDPHQGDANFQTQLEYYVSNIWNVTVPN
jgi:hypothetical protein